VNRTSEYRIRRQVVKGRLKSAIRAVGEVASGAGLWVVLEREYPMNAWFAGSSRLVLAALRGELPHRSARDRGGAMAGLKVLILLDKRPVVGA